VADGERAYERACARRGQRAGAVKPAALDPGLGWEAELGGETGLTQRHRDTEEYFA